jgi:hypothetical protein
MRECTKSLGSNIDLRAVMNNSRRQDVIAAADMALMKS